MAQYILWKEHTETDFKYIQWQDLKNGCHFKKNSDMIVEIVVSDDFFFFFNKFIHKQTENNSFPSKDFAGSMQICTVVLC